jgi:hypothetical protein
MEERKPESPNRSSSKRVMLAPSSTSSIYLTSTMEVPDVKNLFWAIAFVLDSRMNDSTAVQERLLAHKDLALFSEETYIQKRSALLNAECIQQLRLKPNVEHIRHFLTSINVRLRCPYARTTHLVDLSATFPASSTSLNSPFSPACPCT